VTTAATTTIFVDFDGTITEQDLLDRIAQTFGDPEVYAEVDAGLDELDALTRPGAELARPLQRRLRDVMWERCGVVRDENGLREGLREVHTLSETAGNVDVRPGAEGWTDLAHALDLGAGLAVAEATLRCAIERRETRGAHNRADFPDLDPALQVNFYVDARMKPWSEPVPGVPDELRKWTQRPAELGAEGLLE